MISHFNFLQLDHYIFWLTKMRGFSKGSILQDPNPMSITTLMPTATDPCKRVFSIFTIIIREPQRQIKDRTNKIAPIPPSPIFKNQGIRGLLVSVMSCTVDFWCQAIHKKILERFDTSFEIEIMVKICICHWNYFQIPRTLSELPAYWLSQSSQTDWLGPVS